MRRTVPIILCLSLFVAIAGGASPAAAATCPTSVFPNLSGKAGAGAGYAKPSVKVSCTSSLLKVSSNGMPSYTYVAKTPNGLEPQTWNWSVARTPKVAVSTTSIDGQMGTLGFTTTGLPIFGPEEGPVPPDSAHGDPIYNGLVDSCYGHTGYNGDYHNHAIRWTSACGFTKQTIVGYANDGFPIYAGPACMNKACTKTSTLKSGYARTGNPKKNAWEAYTYRSGGSTTLDKCNGRTQPDGTYGYHATSTFPYIIGCFRGTAAAQRGRAAEPMPPMGEALPPSARALFCDLTSRL